MKKSLFVVVLSLLFVAGSFAQTKEKRDVDDFTSVSFGVAGELILKQGNTFSVELEGDRDLLELIETVVRDDRLIIRKDNWFSKMNKKVTVYITMPEVEGLSVSGSGILVCEGALKCGELDLGVSGSGKIDLKDLSADEIDAGISGSGSILVDGSGADDGQLSISGSGSFSGEDFEFGELTVSISGSGNCRCNVDSNLEVRVSGSGDVYYTGNTSVDARVSGSGKVRKF